MQKGIIFFLVFACILALAAGCTSSTSSSTPVSETQSTTIVQTTITHLIEPATQTIPPTMVLASGIVLNYNSTSGNYESAPDLKINDKSNELNTQKNGNPYELSGISALEFLHCSQGIGTVEDCAKCGINLDHDNGNVISENETLRMACIQRVGSG